MNTTIEFSNNKGIIFAKILIKGKKIIAIGDLKRIKFNLTKISI